MTEFQSNAQVFLVTSVNNNVTFNEWAGPIPPVGNRIKLIDGDDVHEVIVSAVEWVTTVTGDFGLDGIVAPSEIYIHTTHPIANLSNAVHDAGTPEIVSAGEHPVMGGSMEHVEQ